MRRKPKPAGAGRPRLYRSASERQAAFRARAMRGEGGIALRAPDPGQGARRVDLFLPTGAVLALRRLARHKGMSQAQVLADLIGQTVKRVTRDMTPGQFDEFLKGGRK